MVTVDTRLNENLLLILNFFFIAFMLGWKAKFSIIELILFSPDDIEVSLGQLKRFNESLIYPKYLLKVEATSFCFDNSLSFSSNIIFSCILLFLFEKYGFHEFQNDLKLHPLFSFSKYWNLTCLFRCANTFCCRLNLTMSIGFFDLLALFLRRDLIIICFQWFLLK